MQARKTREVNLRLLVSLTFWTFSVFGSFSTVSIFSFLPFRRPRVGATWTTFPSWPRPCQANGAVSVPGDVLSDSAPFEQDAMRCRPATRPFARFARRTTHAE